MLRLCSNSLFCSNKSHENAKTNNVLVPLSRFKLQSLYLRHSVHFWIIKDYLQQQVDICGIDENSISMIIKIKENITCSFFYYMRGYLLIGWIQCCFWSFHGICDKNKSMKYHQTYPLNKRIINQTAKMMSAYIQMNTYKVITWCRQAHAGSIPCTV